MLLRAGAIGCALVLLWLFEAVAPRRPRGPWNRAHLAPNAALAAIALASSALLDAALVAALAWADTHQLGLLARLGLGPLQSAALAVAGLDLATYAAHVAMHSFPPLWRLHCVHHSDPAVDVTTALRQHPGETLIRWVVLAALALPLGASPGAYTAYRLASLLSALLEHANFRVPRRIDDGLALAFPWPDFHKVHHSRTARLTDTNYGNLVTWWDRLFGTFTPARRGEDPVYGLDGFDTPEAQSTAALLALCPDRSVDSPRGVDACDRVV